MAKRRAIVPYHFGQRWDILPGRSGDWRIIADQVLSDRLYRIAQFRPDVVVSGDCMVALAAYQEGLHLVWFDAHGDFHTLETTETGHLGGMPLAMMCGLGNLTLLRCVGLQPIAASLVTHVGGSEFDLGERERMIDFGIRVIPALSDWSCTQGAVHLHVDTDVIRSADHPASIHPAPNGLPIQEFLDQLDLVLPYAESLSIKSYDPRIDSGGEGEQILNEILRRYDATHH